MTDQEVIKGLDDSLRAAIIHGAYWLYRWHRSNPEVGMGPGPYAIVEEFLAKGKNPDIVVYNDPNSIASLAQDLYDYVTVGGRHW